jgi:hypothetical protein
VAQAGGPDPYAYFPGAEAHRVDVVDDFELVLAYLLQQCCAHAGSP